jgi:membrane-associated phospholipid phosphatase
MEILRKNVKKFALCFLFIGLLLGSFFWPTWETLDVAVFKFLNGMMEGNRPLQMFWAFLNHKKADLVEDAVFLTFFIIAITSAPRDERLRRSAQFIFCILVAGSIIYFVNRIFLREHILIPRMSPSLVVTPCVRVSQELPWLLVKDETLASFPGDHATTLILFATFYTFFAGWRLGKYACLYATFRMLPRLVLGAHWLSDIIVGSGSLVLFFVALMLCTPFHQWIISGIERGLLIFKNRWSLILKKNEVS